MDSYAKNERMKTTEGWKEMANFDLSFQVKVKPEIPNVF